MRLSILKPANPAAEQFIRPPVVEDAIPSSAYPHNNRNQPEFASVILTLDHLIDSSGFHVHQKAVYSTETARQALTSLMKNYYPSLGASAPVLDDATFEVMKSLDEDPMNAIALYFVPVPIRDRRGGVIAQVILSNVCLQNLVAAPAFGNGSALLAMNALVNSVTDLALKARQAIGTIPPLMLMKLEDDAPVLQEERHSA